jgi:predicted N-acetyltransferase YhbS
MIRERTLSRGEIRRVWEIDRRETVARVYYVESGALVLRAEHVEVSGWPAGEPEKYTPILQSCFDRGGWFRGLFEGERVVGVAVLDSRFIGSGRDQLQLQFLHVGRDHRGQGLGRRLFLLAASEASRRGARSLYVSATPSERTISFYLGFGCRLSPEPDRELFELEPEDIHLECPL